MFVLQEREKEAELARLVKQGELELEEAKQQMNLILSEIDGLHIKIDQSAQGLLKSEEEIKQLQEKAKQHLKKAIRGMEQLESYRKRLVEAFEKFEFENLLLLWLLCNF